MRYVITLTSARAELQYPLIQKAMTRHDMNDSWATPGEEIVNVYMENESDYDVNSIYPQPKKHNILWRERKKPSIVIVIGLAKDQWDEISEILMKNYRRKRFIMWQLFCWLIEIHRYTFFFHNILQSHSRLLFLFYSAFFTMKKIK